MTRKNPLTGVPFERPTSANFRIVPRFPRTLDEAFRTPKYATAIHRTHRSLWRRILSFFLREL